MLLATVSCIFALLRRRGRVLGQPRGQAGIHEVVPNHIPGVGLARWRLADHDAVHLGGRLSNGCVSAAMAMM